MAGAGYGGVVHVDLAGYRWWYIGQHGGHHHACSSRDMDRLRAVSRKKVNTAIWSRNHSTHWIDAQHLGVCPSSCPRLRLNPYPNAGACEHVDELVYAETADLPGQQITDAGLCLVEEIGRLSLGPSTFLNVAAEIEHQVGSYLQV